MGPATSVATDFQSGSIDRFRSLPIPRSAYLLGHFFAEMLGAILTIVILIGTGLLVGWRSHTGILEVSEAMLLLLVFSAAIMWLGLWLGIFVRSPDAVMGIGFVVVFPLTFVSNAFVPISSMPRALQWFASVNPISVLIAAVRELFGNPITPVTLHTWPMDNPIPAAWLYSFVLLGLGLRGRAAPLPEAHGRLSLAMPVHGQRRVRGLRPVSGRCHSLVIGWRVRRVGPAGMADHTRERSVATGRHGRGVPMVLVEVVSRPPTAVLVEEQTLQERILSVGASWHAAQYALVKLVGELDATEGWTGQDVSTCAQWVADALAIEVSNERASGSGWAAPSSTCPSSTPLEAGLSYSKVRVLTHVATRETEQELLDLAWDTPAGRLGTVRRAYGCSTTKTPTPPCACDTPHVRSRGGPRPTASSTVSSGSPPAMGRS